MSFANVGKSWKVDEFKSYLKTLTPPAWAKAVTLHHTASPSLKIRPNGLTDQHVINLRDFYKNEKGWSAGPHLFVDDYRIMGMTPLTEKGVHAVSFNSTSIGIEVLGDYGEEDPHSGRGLECWENAFAATAALLEWLGIEPSSKTVQFHRDDPATSKSCPGDKVRKDWVLLGITVALGKKPAATKHCPTCTCEARV